MKESVDSFTTAVLATIQTSILKQLNKQEFINVPYETRSKLPAGLIEECYRNIDINKVKLLITGRLEEEVADKITNKLLTEYSNDVKQIMGNVELREELRSILRNKIKEAKEGLQ